MIKVVYRDLKPGDIFFNPNNGGIFIKYKGGDLDINCGFYSSFSCWSDLEVYHYDEIDLKQYILDRINDLNKLFSHFLEHEESKINFKSSETKRESPPPKLRVEKTDLQAVAEVRHFDIVIYKVGDMYYYTDPDDNYKWKPGDADIGLLKKQLKRQYGVNISIAESDWKYK